MTSLLCRLPTAAPDLLDEIVLNEASYILDDMDETFFAFVTKSSKIQADALLKAALEHAPDAKGKAWLARIIYATDGDRGALVRVAKLFFRELLLPMKLRSFELFQGQPKSVSALQNGDEPSYPFTLSKKQTALRNKLLSRDGKACCVFGQTVSSASPPKVKGRSDEQQLTMTHIIPSSMHEIFDKHEMTVFDSCVFWEVMNQYAPSVDPTWMRAHGIPAPSNVLMLSPSTHKAFINLDLCLVETAIPNAYDVRNWVRDPWLARALEREPVQLKDHSETGIDVPSPKLLKLHASLCRIIHSCGAGRALDRAIKDSLHIQHLNEDGTTDVNNVILILSAFCRTPVY